MPDIPDWVRMMLLILKAKLVKLFKSPVVQSMFTFDITFIFLFLALKLIGYQWSVINLIGCFGLWILTKELFKHTKSVASEFRKK